MNWLRQLLNSEDKADYGMRLAVAVSLGLHALMFGGLFGYQYVAAHVKPARKPPPAISVALAQRPNTGSGGKKSKAPVAGRKRPKPQPRVKQKAVKSKPKAPKRAKNEVGRKPKPRKSKPPPKPKPQPVEQVEQAAENSQPGPAEPEPPEQETGALARGGFGGEDNSGLSLEVGNPDQQNAMVEGEFVSYLRLLVSQVQRRWSKGGLRGGVAILRFSVARGGGVSQIEVVQSAGQSFLDSAAKRAVLGLDLPPLPQGYQGDALIVNLNFNYTK